MNVSSTTGYLWYFLNVVWEILATFFNVISNFEWIKKQKIVIFTRALWVYFFIQISVIAKFEISANLSDFKLFHAFLASLDSPPSMSRAMFNISVALSEKISVWEKKG